MFEKGGSLRENSPFPALEAKILWPLFGLYTLVNCLLAFSALSFVWKAVLGVLGLLVPTSLFF